MFLASAPITPVNSKKIPSNSAGADDAVEIDPMTMSPLLRGTDPGWESGCMSVSSGSLGLNFQEEDYSEPDSDDEMIQLTISSSPTQRLKVHETISRLGFK